MKIKNVEIKAKTNNPDFISNRLVELKARYIGCDEQIDTYFNINHGRLKLRQGHIENSLIHYNRADKDKAKLSDISFSKIQNGSDILDVLKSALGIKVIVKKKRHIYFIDHVKFHIDHLDGLGSFVEIEVIDLKNEYSEIEMRSLCELYMKELKVESSDLLTHSYSDMLGI